MADDPKPVLAKPMDTKGKVSTKVTYSDTPSPEVQRALEEKRMDLESGVLGKFFGSAASAPSNIAGLTLVFLVLASIVYCFFPAAALSPGEFLKFTAPLITLVFGYLFGKKS